MEQQLHKSLLSVLPIPTSAWWLCCPNQHKQPPLTRDRAGTNQRKTRAGQGQLWGPGRTCRTPSAAASTACSPSPAGDTGDMATVGDTVCEG